MVYFVCVACANRAYRRTFPVPFQLGMFSSSELCLLGGKEITFRLDNLSKEYKVLVHNLWKSVCVRVEHSIAEEKEDTLGWEANRSVGYCLPCAGAAVGAGQNEFCFENRHPSDDIKPAALENESLDEERSDNIEPACELACESRFRQG